MERLATYQALLEAWQARMNLVGPATLANVWTRHFQDSLQLTKLVPPGRSWVDIGSGGGFPGMVLAAADWGQFTLVDATAKKCRFLHAVREALGLESRVEIVHARIEALPPLDVEVATARATAPLATLLSWAGRHVRAPGLYVFPKGRSWEAELADARRRFAFTAQALPSETDPDARILRLQNVRPR
jgi:16S rRNA (guanine527-N7)-methyltransferase